MDRFVVGFAFSNCDDPENRKVLLVKKQRPQWQKGRLNGIGGKIEGNETPWAAMDRESLEEAGICLDWQYRGILKGTNFDGHPFECHLFYAYSSSVEEFRQREDESLGLYDPGALSGYRIVDSLDFLIPFGLSGDQKPFMTLIY